MISLLEQAPQAPVTPEPVIQRTHEWVMSLESQQLQPTMMLKVHDTVIPLDEVAVEVDPSVDFSNLPESESINKQREALAIAAGRIIGQEAGKETGHEANRFTSVPKLWVAFNGVRRNNDVLSAAPLRDVVKAEDGTIAIEVIDTDGNIATVPAGSEVHLYTEHKMQQDSLKKAQLSHGHAA